MSREVGLFFNFFKTNPNNCPLAAFMGRIGEQDMDDIHPLNGCKRLPSG